MRIVAGCAIALTLALAGCGSDDDPQTGGGVSEPVAAAEVETALAAELQSGGGEGGVVELEGAPPKSVNCTEDTPRSTWRCEVTPANGGERSVCVVKVEAGTRRITSRTCGRVDN